MADLVVVVASVKRNSGNANIPVVGGATITRGKVVYKDTADDKFKLAVATAQLTALAAGIAMTDGYNSSDMAYAPEGATIDLGVTTVAGMPYCVSAAAAGGIAPYTDLVSTNWPTILFIGTGTSVVTIKIIVSPVAKP